MNHRCSVFKNSCLRVPVDPVSKMPRTAYERKKKTLKQHTSIDSVSTTCSVSTADVDAEKLKDFYRSIPDYNDINHLPSEQFYSTLKSLREKKKIMLGLAVEHIDDCNHHHTKTTIEDVIHKSDEMSRPPSVKIKDMKFKVNTLSRKHSTENNYVDKEKNPSELEKSDFDHTSLVPSLKRPSRKKMVTDDTKRHIDDDLKLTPDLRNPVKESVIKHDRPRRNQSACSISWNDARVESKTEVDKKFDQYFDGRKYTSPTKVEIGDDFKTQSMPSSPLRIKRARSSPRRRKSITVPKPFKMTERDEEERIVHELRSLRKSFSDEMLHVKHERQLFRANPVPIESRIPLYDKILEDQAMRRAITKINSEAELRAQIKPFSFTKREEKGINGLCERAVQSLPKSKKKKRFKARPFPKNLFSNYFYEKMREDDFFRGMNRRIRAEEMLKNAHLPSSMATRERSRLSTPGAHSDLPIDPSPAAISSSSSERQRCSSPMKGRKRDKTNKEDLITTSPQPFKFSTADRAAKKMQDITRKIYQESRSSDTKGNEGPRAYSALDLRAVATGRSNLAALLRAETVRQRFEMEQVRRLADQERRAELRARDRILRSKPSWHLVKNNHEEDIAMRLQTRRDEERMRREEFLHEMELMYGRVQQQPMLFERYYAPRSHSAPFDTTQLSPRKQKKRSKKNFHLSPMRSRKVSINDTPEAYNGDVNESFDRIDHVDISDSEVPIDSDRI